jgi:hypothetical protein
MNYALLRLELTTDPVSLGYSTLNDIEAANKLNATDTNRTIPRTSVAASEVIGCIDNAAWPSTALEQNKLSLILSIDPIDINNNNIRGVLGAIFPNSSPTLQTRQRLLSLGIEIVSRAIELKLGHVVIGDVTLARSKSGGW